MGNVFDEIQGQIAGKANRPVWMMRQAGRYLPEYRAVRAKFPTFLDFCYTPDAATEVTLQPIDRFGFDAAIIFSDILVIPQALGQEVWFVTGEGPKLGPLPDLDSMQGRIDDGSFIQHLEKVYTAIGQSRAALPSQTDLFGFAGAPWTLLTYMIEGGSSQDYANALKMAADQPDHFGALLSLVEQAVDLHLSAQVKAGANLLQVFDSWAGGIPNAADQKTFSFDPLVRLANAQSEAAPVVVFSKGLAQQFSATVESELNSNIAIAVGQDQDLGQARAGFLGRRASQGNVNPELMAGDWSQLKSETSAMLASLDADELHVVNLGHGIRPDGNADNVARWVDLVRETAR